MFNPCVVIAIDGDVHRSAGIPTAAILEAKDDIPVTDILQFCENSPGKAVFRCADYQVSTGTGKQDSLPGGSWAGRKNAELNGGSFGATRSGDC